MDAEKPEQWFSNEAATFGDRLSAARETAGLTQEDLAARLGVRMTTLQAWEDDGAEPRGNRLQMLAGMLNVSLMWLMSGEGDGLDGPASGDTEENANAALRRELRDLRRTLEAVSARMIALEDRLED
jgi:HTH-type transcriptional regulator, cell division transcriptional repressor